ncbi:hypothetical protein [Segetibacter koreensis]|uniref:hypothetical protein n=1 Tax=Segetibacter koreensis TaxID=398037 RepID=UPI000362DAEE|nr:hypothetical protein [Segetibacter koreensis]
MRRVLFFAVIIGLTQVACKKSNSSSPVPSALNGKWRMIVVKDNTSGLTTTKPSSIQNDVVITFTPTNSTTGTFIGNTPTNEIGRNEYSIGANQTISIPVLAMTKVGETSWGTLFVDHIRSSQQYTFEVGGILNIKTANKTLTFSKL